MRNRLRKIWRRLALGLTLVILLRAVCLAPAYAEDATAESNAVAINTVWTLLAAFLVFFMQAGFAMVETGFTRAKNACNIMMKNLTRTYVKIWGHPLNLDEGRRNRPNNQTKP